MALRYVLSFPFWGNSVPLGHPCSQSCSLQDSVFYAIVSFCDTLRSFFVFVFSILVSSIFPRKPILTAFFFSSDKCLPASAVLPKSVPYVLLPHSDCHSASPVENHLLPYIAASFLFLPSLFLGGPCPYLSDEFIIPTGNLSEQG